MSILNVAKELRVFISSTFTDMQSEREHLVKHVFPELRQICRERGVVFTEIDLRWGITERQARRRRIVSTCLDEIDRHEPFVIGLIGDRCGWRPTREDICTDGSLLVRYPWLAEAVAAQRSIVEIETLECTRHNVTLASRTHFYFRQSNEQTDDVKALRERILSSGLRVRGEYRDIETLGEWVREDLLSEIDRRLTVGRTDRFIDQERCGHEAFGASRRRDYVEDRVTLEQLDEHCAAGVRPLVICGESGAGKSALLAYWSNHYRQLHSDAFIIIHHVGATAASTSHVSLMRRVMFEIQDRFGLSAEVPSMQDKVESEFDYWLGYARETGLILVIDALNQLSEPSRRTLNWLSTALPAFVRLIVSTTDGEILTELEGRGWPILRVEPLKREMRQRVVQEYFRCFGKELDGRNVRRLVSDPKSVSPLYLITTMEELRVHGSYDQISRRLEHYLQAKDLRELFQRVLERLEGDYGSRLVRGVMTLVWASRGGLSETELLELLGCRQLELTRLLHALEYHLLRREGLLGFFHEYLRDAVEQRYLTRKRILSERYERLIGYFERHQNSTRSTLEILAALEQQASTRLRPHAVYARILSILSQRDRLLTVLGDETASVVLRASARAQECLGGEALVSALRAAATRTGAFDSQSELRALRQIGELLDRLNHWEASLEFALQRKRLAAACGDTPNEAWALAEIGGLQQQMGNYDKAENALTKAIREFEGINDSKGLSEAESKLGILFAHRGAFDKAQRCFRRQEELSRALGDWAGIARAVGNMGAIHGQSGSFELALECFEQELAIHRELGSRKRIARVYGNIGAACVGLGRYDKALTCLEQQAEMCRELGDRYGLSLSLRNIGVVYSNRGDAGRALEYYEKTAAMAEELGDRSLLASALGAIGSALSTLGSYAAALSYCKRQAEMCLQLGERAGEALASGRIGTIYFGLGDNEAARTHYLRQAEIAHEINDRIGYTFGVGYTAVSYAEEGALEDAIVWLSDAIQLAREIGYRHLLTHWLNALAACLLDTAESEVEPSDVGREYIRELTSGAAHWRESIVDVASGLGQEAHEMSVELGISEHIHNAEVIRQRIRIMRGEQEAGIAALDGMLQCAIGDDQRADLHYWLWRYAAQNAIDGHNAHARRLYTEILLRSPRVIFRRRLAELELAVGHA